jgi:streptomycin 3"-adenylyltransferase
VDEATERYLERLVARLRASFEDELVGVYLHGSAALGGYVSARSDLDVLAVIDRRTTAAEQRDLGATLLQLPCPAAGGLEFSLVTRASVQTPQPAPSFEVHVNGGERRIVHGTAYGGDQDLVLHFEICRREGRTLHGEEASTLFASESPPALLAKCVQELRWIEEHFTEPPLESSVLQACRALRFREDGQLCSKVAGGEWAVSRGIGGDLVRRAVLAKQGLPTDPLDPSAVLAFVRAARNALAMR